MKLHLPKQLFTALLAAITLAAPAALTLGSTAWGANQTFTGTGNTNINTSSSEAGETITFQMTDAGSSAVSNNYFEGDTTYVTAADIVISDDASTTETLEGLVITNGNQNNHQVYTGSLTGDGILKKVGNGDGNYVTFEGDARGYTGNMYLGSSYRFELTFGGRESAVAAAETTTDKGIAGTGDVFFSADNNHLNFNYSASENPVYITNAISESSACTSTVNLKGGANYIFTKSVAVDTIDIAAETSWTLQNNRTFNAEGGVKGDGTLIIDDGATAEITVAKAIKSHVQVNGGGTLKSSVLDGTWYNSDSSTKSITLAGTSDAKMATFEVTERQTFITPTYMNGNAQISGTGSLQLFGATFTVSGTNNIISTALSTSRASVFDIDEGGTLEITGQITRNSNYSSDSITKRGDGELILSNANNSIQGGLIIEDGEVTISGNSTLSINSTITNNGSLTIANGAKLKINSLSGFNSTADYTLSGEDGTYGYQEGLTLTYNLVTGTGNITLDGSVMLGETDITSSVTNGQYIVTPTEKVYEITGAYKGSVIEYDGSSDGSSDDTAQADSFIVREGASLKITDTANSDGALGKNISGAGTLIIAAAANDTISFTGSSMADFTGTVDVISGAVYLGNVAGAGAGAAADFAASKIIVRNGAAFWTHMSAETLGADIDLLSGATLGNKDKNNDYQGNIRFNIVDPDAETASYNKDGVVTINQYWQKNVKFSGLLEGEGIVQMKAANVEANANYELSNASNTFAGTYKVIDGDNANNSGKTTTLKLSSATAAQYATIDLASTGAVSVLKLAGNSTIAALYGSDADNYVTTDATGTLTVSEGSFGGKMQNGSNATLSLTKTGSGTLTLSGTAGTSEARLGGITVTEGSLNLQGTTYVNAVTVGGGELTFGGTSVTHDATSLKVYGGTVNINNSSTTLGTLSFGSSNGTTGGTVEFTKAEGQESATYTVGTIESANAGGYTRNLTVGEGVTLEATNFTNSWGMGTMTINGTLTVNGEMKFATGDNAATSNNVLTGSGIVCTEKLIIGNSGKYNFSGLTLKIGSGGIIKDTANFWGGYVMLNLGALTIEATGDWSSDLNKIKLVGATGAPTVFNTAGHTITMSAGGISGTGELKKAGEGTLTLSGANTYSGGTTIEAGTVTTQNASALGTGGVNMTGGELVVSNVANTDTDLTVGGDIVMNDAATAKLATTGTTLSLGTTGSVKKSNADGSQHVTIASDGTNAASMTAKADNAQLVQLQEDASFTIQDMTLTNTTITAATPTTQVNFSNVTVEGATVLRNMQASMTDPNVTTGGSEGVKGVFTASTSLLSGITLAADSTITVDLGDLSCAAPMDQGKYDLSITLSGFTMGDYSGLATGAGLVFAADSWLGILLNQAQNAKVQMTIAQAEAGAAAAAEGGSASGVSYSTGNVGTIITITGLNVPEPTTATLSLLALAALAARRRRND